MLDLGCYKDNLKLQKEGNSNNNNSITKGSIWIKTSVTTYGSVQT